MKGEHCHLWRFSGCLQKYFEERELKYQALVDTQLICYIVFGHIHSDYFRGSKQESQ